MKPSNNLLWGSRDQTGAIVSDEISCSDQLILAYVYIAGFVSH